MRIKKTLSLAALTAVTGAAAFGGAASAATIADPVVVKPGGHIPIDFAGYKEPANRTLPKNMRIVRVSVEVARGERPTVTLKAPKGFGAVTIGFDGRHQVGGVVAGKGSYSGQRSVRVRLFANANLVDAGETGKATLYLLARRA
jgi:hypothetical protein